MGIIAWVSFGALTGWVASRIAATNREMGWLENIMVGIVGAFLFSLLTGGDNYMAFNFGSFLVAVIGALVLLFILRLVRPPRACYGLWAARVKKRCSIRLTTATKGKPTTTSGNRS